MINLCFDQRCKKRRGRRMTNFFPKTIDQSFFRVEKETHFKTCFWYFISFFALRERVKWNIWICKTHPLILHLLLSSHKDTSELTPAFRYTHTHTHTNSLSKIRESCHNKHSQKLLMTFKNADGKNPKEKSLLEI